MAAAALTLAWIRPSSMWNNWPIRLDDRLAYSAHGVLGTVLDRLGAPPIAVATQWLKAAAHARSEEQTEQAARGLAAAAARATEGDRLEYRLCTSVAHDQIRTQAVAAQRAGLGCDTDQFTVAHVPEGSAVAYRTRPPTAGAHYPVAFPRRGVVEEPVAPGYWVHNLEHGEIVLLYSCPEDCADLVARLRALYVTLPLSPSARSGEARLLAVPFAQMDHRIAVVAWGQVLELDEFDERQVRAFYETHVDRGPECQDRRCRD
jgi:hypothetical protein